MKAHHALPSDAEAWLADHPDLAPADLEMPWRLAEGVDPLSAAPAPDPQRIRAMEQTLAQAAHGAGPRSLRLVVSGRRSTWLAAAAVVALLLAVGLGWRLTPVTLSAAAGSPSVFTLPDGSQIQLHGGASLRHARSFGRDSRRVRLSGEAFFDVVQTGLPFVIETFNATVTVHGTSFNVRAWPMGDAAETVVSVVTGVVEVAASEDPATRVRLEPGQGSRVVAVRQRPSAPTAIRIDEVTAWRRGGFVFYDQPFAVIFGEIERRFGISVHAADQIMVRRRTFSMHQARSAEAVLRDLCQSAGLRYRAVAGGYEIFDPEAHDTL